MVLGVVSEADILLKGARPRAAARRDRRGLLGNGHVDERKLEARTAGDAMTSPAITIGVDRDVSFAARSMTEYGIKRLPVVDDDGALVGIVTRADLVRAFARSDEEIEREIGETVLRTLWIEEPALEVRVENGEVRLSGKLGRRSDAELLMRFVSRVPGVVSVHSTVRWAGRRRRRDGRRHGRLTEATRR